MFVYKLASKHTSLKLQKKQTTDKSGQVNLILSPSLVGLYAATHD